MRLRSDEFAQAQEFVDAEEIVVDAVPVAIGESLAAIPGTETVPEVAEPLTKLPPGPRRMGGANQRQRSSRSGSRPST
ncbi:MAG: hypothetical protein R2873_35935 [Caldilineaceae bacterium]